MNDNRYMGYWKGKKRSEQDRLKMSLSAKRPERIAIAISNLPKDISGNKNPFFGKKHSSEYLAKRTGVNSPIWKGGPSICIDCNKVLNGYGRKRCRTCWSKTVAGENHPNFKGGYENTLMHNRKRRVMKLGNGGTHSLADWNELKTKFNHTCPCCLKKEPQITLSEDHIIPLSKGGTDDIVNIQPLCRSCNSKKRTKIIKYELTA